MKKYLFALGATAMTFPLVTFAATTPGANLSGFITWVNKLIQAAIPLIISLAVVFFLWGVFKYVASGDSEEERKNGRQLMINGVIAIFVMVSLWGLVGFLDSSLGLNDSKQDPPEYFTIPSI